MTQTTKIPNSGIAVTINEAMSPWLANPQTVVFHHGLGARGDCWRGWLGTIGDQFRQVMFDMRGHGQSPVNADHVWTLDGMVEDLAAVIDAVAPNETIHLVGESIGGTIALAYAARQPDRLNTLTISNGAHQGGPLGNLSDWQQIIDRGGMAAWSRHMMNMRFNPDGITEAMWRWYEAQQAQCDPRSVLAGVNLLTGADLSEEMNRIAIPVLLMHPDSSPFIPVAVMADLKAKLPDARLRVFPDARHGLPFSHARECAAQWLQFATSADARVSA